MQYALIKLDDTRMHLVDAAELQLIDTEAKGGLVPEIHDDQDNAPTRDVLAYGAYLPNPHIPDAEVPDLARQAIGYGLGFYDSASARLRCFELVDLALGSSFARGHSRRLPFAALLRIAENEDLPWRKASCITAFLRYLDMTPGTNVLSRPGVFSLTAPERRQQRKGSWQERVDFERATKLARRIH